MISLGHRTFDERGRLLFVIIVVMDSGRASVYRVEKPSISQAQTNEITTYDNFCGFHQRLFLQSAVSATRHSLCIDLVGFILPPALGIFVDGRF